MLKARLIPILLLLILNNINGQQTVGLFLNTEESLNGYTLIAPMTARQTYLIDNCGYLINSWQSEYLPKLSAYLLEDGSLLRSAARIDDSIKGRVERFDWDGNIIWSYDFDYEDYTPHHDIEYLPNGNILFIASELKPIDEAIEAGLDTTGLGDKEYIITEIIVEVEPYGTNGGTIMWEWHAWDHFVQDFSESIENYALIYEHPELININYISESSINGYAQRIDLIHANSIDYNEELDQILISTRHFSEVWIIDHSTTTDEAAGHVGGNYGKGGDLLYRWGNPQSYDRGNCHDQAFFGQHDANWISKNYPDEDNIIVYNNNNLDSLENFYSSVDVISPPISEDGSYYVSDSLPFEPYEKHWQYIASPPNRFHSKIISGAQRLSNGNTLICEGAKGHLFEVDYNGNKVWDYISPIEYGQPMEQGEIPNENHVFRSYRYGTDYSAFTDKVLIPGDPIELNPLPYDCTIYNTVGIEEEINNEGGFQAYPNPFNNEISVIHELDVNVIICIYNIAGQLMHKSTVMGGVRTVIPSLNWNRGMYIIRLSNENGIKIGEYKLVKQ